MATRNVIQTAASATDPHRVFANALTLDIFRLRYQARAALALLERCPSTEDSDDLMGVSFALSMIEERCSALSTLIGDADLASVLKGACNG